MTPNQKALDLIHNITWNTLISRKKAIICALITVDELIKETRWETPNIRERLWIEVKEELEKLKSNKK